MLMLLKRQFLRFSSLNMLLSNLTASFLRIFFDFFDLGNEFSISFAILTNSGDGGEYSCAE
jgi:hypothetical protein